jgi:hypothetical protein
MGCVVHADCSDYGGNNGRCVVCVCVCVRARVRVWITCYYSELMSIVYSL